MATKPGRAPYCPHAGDLIWIDLEPTKGHEQRGRRPAVVLSSHSYHRRSGLCVACPITHRAKGYPFEVTIPEGHGVTGVVLADQIRTLSWAERDAELIGPAPRAVLDDAREMIAALLEIE